MKKDLTDEQKEARSEAKGFAKGESDTLNKKYGRKNYV